MAQPSLGRLSSRQPHPKINDMAKGKHSKTRKVKRVRAATKAQHEKLQKLHLNAGQTLRPTATPARAAQAAASPSRAAAIKANESRIKVARGKGPVKFASMRKWTKRQGDRATPRDVMGPPPRRVDELEIRVGEAAPAPRVVRHVALRPAS